MNRRKLTKFEELVLNSPTCLLWPNCACRHNIEHSDEALDDKTRIFDMETLEYAADLLYFTMACVSEHCPDPEIKAYGARQFANLTRRRQRIAQEQLTASAN
jgi:hypothetical protein